MLPCFPFHRYPSRVGIAHLRVAGIDLERLSGLRIDEPSDANVGEKALAWILDGYGDDIMTLRQQLERMIDVRLEKIGDDEHDRMLVKHPRDVIDRSQHVRSAANRLQRQKIADDTQHVSSSLPRWNDVLDAIGEQENTNPIVVPDGGHRQHGGKLTGQLALESFYGSESLRSGEIDDEHDRQLALFDVSLDQGPAHPCAYVPVDRPDLIAWLVLAHFGELHALTLEDGSVFAGKN